MKYIYSLLLVVVLFLFSGNKVFAGGCTAPPAPTLTSAVVDDCGSVTVTWANGGGSTTHFYVYFCTSQWAGCHAAGSPDLYTTGTTSMTFTGLTASTLYYWRIRAYNSSSGGCFGGEISGSVNTGSCGTCSDGILNQDETGIDCGGATCPACPVSCADGILNQDETGVDCGGATCPPCAAVSCFDGIMNGTETGVDCGGSCAISCTPQTQGTSSDDCSAGSTNTVYPTNCDQVGTSAYGTNSPNVNFTSTGTSTAPSPAPPCGSVGGEGTWVHVDLEASVTQVQMAFTGGTVASGSSNSYAAAYQGTCGSLSYVDCANAVSFISSQYGVYQVVFSGLDPAQDLWIFMYNDGGKSFDLDFDLIGTATAPSNTTCATADAAIGNACNLGAPGASFTTPGAAGVSCSGGSWGSNENTVFYSFTPTATSATLEVGSITCNDGTSGAAQFGVWTSCAVVGSYGAGDFLGCAVGTSTLSLTGLTIGQTYYIATDGFAGDNCVWDFTGTNIVVLPIELLDFKVKLIDNHEVKLDWITTSEINNDFFTIERSLDGEIFEVVDVVSGAGNSNMIKKYDLTDGNPYRGTSYYRLAQTDYDGATEYTGLVAVNVGSSFGELSVFPNPIGGVGYLSFVSSSSVEDVNVVVYDIAGRVVMNKNYDAVKGNNRFKLETEELSQGMYFLTINNQQEATNLKFIKE